MLGASKTRVEHRHHRLVGEHHRRREQDGAQSCHHRRDLGRRIADPERQSRTIQCHALACKDLRLSVERQVVGVARDQHLCHQRFGRDPALDQPRRRGRLHDRALAAAADQLGAPGDDDPELRRHHVEPFGPILPDRRHRRAAARAVGVLRSQRHLDARQVGRQRTPACT